MKSQQNAAYSDSGLLTFPSADPWTGAWIQTRSWIHSGESQSAPSALLDQRGSKFQTGKLSFLFSVLRVSVDSWINRKKHEAIEHSSVFLKCFLSSFCYSDVSVTPAQRRTSSPRTPLQCSDVLKSVSHLCWYNCSNSSLWRLLVEKPLVMNSFSVQENVLLGSD